MTGHYTFLLSGALSEKVQRVYLHLSNFFIWHFAVGLIDFLESCVELDSFKHDECMHGGTVSAFML